MRRYRWDPLMLTDLLMTFYLASIESILTFCYLLVLIPKPAELDPSDQHNKNLLQNPRTVWLPSGFRQHLSGF